MVGHKMSKHPVELLIVIQQTFRGATTRFWDCNREGSPHMMEGSIKIFIRNDSHLYNLYKYVYFYLYIGSQGVGRGGFCPLGPSS
jgi:hypothetical protein